METEKQGYWVVIPADLLHQNLTKACLYGIISSYCNASGRCFAGNKTLAGKLGMKTGGRIRKYLTELEDEGWISIENRSGKNREIGISSKFQPATKKHQRATNVAGQPATKSAHSNISRVLSDSNTCENKFSQEIPLVIEKFKKLSPSLSYGNKTQRKACQEMLELWGVDEVLRMVDTVLSAQKDRFAPRAATPDAMWKKLGDFKIYFSSRNKSIIDIPS